MMMGMHVPAARGEDHLMGTHSHEDEREMDHSTGAPLLKRALFRRFDFEEDEDEEAEGHLTVSPHMHQLQAHMRTGYPLLCCQHRVKRRRGTPC